MDYCKNCGNPLILSDGECIYCHHKLSGSDRGTGEIPHHYDNANYPDGQSQPGKSGDKHFHADGEPLPPTIANQDNVRKQICDWFYIINTGSIKKWISRIIFVILLILLWMLLHSVFTKMPSQSSEKPIERKTNTELHPQDITGNYFVRMMKGREDVNATVKIYNEGGEYAMNVYSSGITKKYIFSYDSSTGEIFSQELGNGTVRIKELTNEIEITFEGWKLVK